MIRFSKLPENIISLIPDAVNYLQSREDVIFAYLFGSLAKGKKTPLSDVDIALYLSQKSRYIQCKMDIFGSLADILKTDEIDLVILNSASLTLKIKILENKRLLVDKAPFLRHKYESLTMREYFDFSIHEKAILEKRFLYGR